MVAAWIRAETGVGPAIASGSQTKRGSCADLPATPSRKNNVIAKIKPGLLWATWAALAKISSNRRDPKPQKIRNIAIKKPKSPIRLVTKAFLAALALPMPSAPFSNQNPMRR
jgi:hypothetical protein